MNWNKGWDTLFYKYEWGKYPSEIIIRFIKKSIYNNAKNINILEIGCGTGANLWFFAKEGYNTYGIDGSNTALIKAKKLLTNHKTNANLFKGDIVNLPYEDNFFDIVIDSECLYSNDFESSKIILKEINRVLKNKGSFLSITFGTKTWGYGNGKKYKNEPHTFKKIEKGALKKDYGLVRFIDLKGIKKLYKDFHIEEIEKLTRTINNRRHKIEEWIITCIKND